MISVSVLSDATRVHCQVKVASVTVSPSGSLMSEASAVSVSPAMGVGLSMVGTPVGAALSLSRIVKSANSGCPSLASPVE